VCDVDKNFMALSFNALQPSRCEELYDAENFRLAEATGRRLSHADGSLSQ
jgi:hypothetical protein